METVFSLSSLLVMPFWFLMIFLPKWSWTKRILSSIWTVILAALLYAILVIPNLFTVLPAVLNPDLASISTLLASPSGATIAWVHFLAFDLFVGRWAYLDSQKRAIHPIIMALILFFILMLGPLGFLLYLGARALSKQSSESSSAVASA